MGSNLSYQKEVGHCSTQYKFMDCWLIVANQLGKKGQRQSPCLCDWLVVFQKTRLKRWFFQFLRFSKIPWPNLRETNHRTLALSGVVGWTLLHGSNPFQLQPRKLRLQWKINHLKMYPIKDGNFPVSCQFSGVYVATRKGQSKNMSPRITEPWTEKHIAKRTPPVMARRKTKQ